MKGKSGRTFMKFRPGTPCCPDTNEFRRTDRQVTAPCNHHPCPIVFSLFVSPSLGQPNHLKPRWTMRSAYISENKGYFGAMAHQRATYKNIDAPVVGRSFRFLPPILQRVAPFEKQLPRIVRLDELLRYD